MFLLSVDLFNNNEFTGIQIRPDNYRASSWYEITAKVSTEVKHNLLKESFKTFV